MTASQAQTEPVQADVLVIGGGSAGEAIAVQLAEAGRRVVLAESGLVGGECKYLACVPSKAMLRSAGTRHEGSRWTELGAAADDPDRGADDVAYRVAVRRRDDLSQHRDDAATAKTVVAAGVQLIRARAHVTGPGTATAAGREVQWNDLVVATGSAPNVPDLPGLDEVPVWDSAQAMSSQDRPASVALLGGGAVGCEMAQMFARFGVEVSLIEPSGQLLGEEETSVAKVLREHLEQELTSVHVGVSPVRAENIDGRARLHLDDGTVLDVDRVVLSAGRHPRTERLGLERLGLSDLERGVEIDDTCRAVGVDHVWAAGDVTGRTPYTHAASYQARVLVANLLGGDAHVVDNAIPRAVYTDPPVASVGLDSEAARRAGVEPCTSTWTLDDLPRNNTDGGAGGRLVLTADHERGVLIGAAAIGPHADEWIGEAVLAVRARVPLSVLAEVVHPFPTYATALESAYRELLDACR